MLAVVGGDVVVMVVERRVGLVDEGFEKFNQVEFVWFGGNV
jgi:hypothetical protein